MNAYKELEKGIKWVLDNCSSYEVAIDLDIANRTVNRYQNGTTPIENMQLKTAKLLYNYYKERVKMFKHDYKNALTLEFQFFGLEEMLKVYERFKYSDVDLQERPNQEEIKENFLDMICYDIEELIDAENELEGTYDIGYHDRDLNVNNFLVVDYAAKENGKDAYIVTVGNPEKIENVTP